MRLIDIFLYPCSLLSVMIHLELASDDINFITTTVNFFLILSFSPMLAPHKDFIVF